MVNHIIHNNMQYVCSIPSAPGSILYLVFKKQNYNLNLKNRGEILKIVLGDRDSEP